MTDQTAAVPGPLLQEVRELCCHQLDGSLNVNELREHLDKLSLFAGENPLVSSFSCTVACDGNNVLWCVQEVAGLKKEDLPSDSTIAAGSSSTLSESHALHKFS